jgi:hypothetical protein
MQESVVNFAPQPQAFLSIIAYRKALNVANKFHGGLNIRPITRLAQQLQPDLPKFDLDALSQIPSWFVLQSRCTSCRNLAGKIGSFEMRPMPCQALENRNSAFFREAET